MSPNLSVLTCLILRFSSIDLEGWFCLCCYQLKSPNLNNMAPKWNCNSTKVTANFPLISGRFHILIFSPIFSCGKHTPFFKKSKLNFLPCFLWVTSNLQTTDSYLLRNWVYQDFQKNAELAPRDITESKVTKILTCMCMMGLDVTSVFWSVDYSWWILLTENYCLTENWL